MVTNGLIVIVVCLVLRLVKRLVRQYSTEWALLSIAYTVGIHVGAVMIVWGVVLHVW